MHNPAPTSIESIARGVLLVSDKILLCQNSAVGYHYLPGGHIDPGEQAANALAREFLEETGLIITVGKHLLTSESIFHQQGVPKHEITIVFHVEHSDPLPDPIPSLEPDIQFHFVAPEDLESLDFRPLSTKKWLINYLANPAAAPHWNAANST